MGGRWRRRNHRHSDDFQFQLSDRWNQSPGEATIPIEDVPLGPYTVSGCGRRDNTNRNPFRPNDTNSHNPRVFFQTTGNSFQRQRTTPTITRTESDFRIRSTRFRQYILQALNQTLRQVQQWYPDDEPVSESEMDWQPESELVIPQSAEKIHYIWDQEPAPSESASTWEDRGSPEIGIGLGISTQTGRRAASEGNNELEQRLSPGWSHLGLEEWRPPPKSGFAIPRTMPSPEVDIES